MRGITKVVIKRFGGSGNESSKIMVIDEIELQMHHQLEKIYRSTRGGRVWDTRQRSCCNTSNVHEEYISDMTYASDSMKLLATRDLNKMRSFFLLSLPQWRWYTVCLQFKKQQGSDKIRVF